MSLKRHLLAACCSPPAHPKGRRGWWSAVRATRLRGTALLRAAMLDGHARERAAVGVSQLVWNDTLAAHALVYAQEMARTRRFQHAEQPHGPAREGENLWTGTRGAYRYDEMFGLRAAEKRDFVNLPTPAFSRTGRWQDVAHYT